MARFMTREIEGILKRLRAEILGHEKMSVGVQVETYCWCHSGHDIRQPDVSIVLFNPLGANEHLHLRDYSTIEVMEGEALAKVREWKEAGK